MCARVPRLRIPPSYPIPSSGAPARQRTRYPVNCYYLLYHVNVGVYMKNTNSLLSGSAIYVSRFLMAVFHNYLATKTAAYSKYFAIGPLYSAREIYSVIKTETYSSKNSSFAPINSVISIIILNARKEASPTRVILCINRPRILEKTKRSTSAIFSKQFLLKTSKTGS